MKLLHCETQGRNESLSVKTRFPTSQALCALSFFFHDFLPSRPVPLLLLYFSNSVFISLVYLFFLTSSTSLFLPIFFSSIFLLSLIFTHVLLLHPMMCHNIAWKFIVSLCGFPVIIFLIRVNSFISHFPCPKETKLRCFLFLYDMSPIMK